MGLDNQVTLVGPPVGVEEEQEEAARLNPAAEQKAAMEHEDKETTGAPGPTISEQDEDSPTQQGQAVGNLPSALKGVTSVTSSASFEEAFTKMRLNGYSQLPVLDGPRNLRGAVTWESIARARHANAAAQFADAIVDAHAVSYTDHLIDVLSDLERFGFVLVKDQTNQIAGIITVADVAAEYGATARPFLLIGDLDRQLRWVISEGLDLAEVIALCDPDGRRKLTVFDQLSYGDYQQVLSNQKQWDRLGGPLDRKSFTARLDELREIRNELMHFNDKDKVGDSAIPMLRNMLGLLREHGG